MAHEELFTIRMNPTQRQLQAAVAARYGLTESAVLRMLVRRAADELGILPHKTPTLADDHGTVRRGQDEEVLK